METPRNPNHVSPTPYAQPPVRVVVVMDDLAVGGAERILADEARTYDPRRVSLHVVALGEAPGSPLEREVREAGVSVVCVPGVGLRDPVRLLRLVQTFKALDADVVHTHTDYANILGLAAARLAGIPAIATLHGMTSYQSRNAGVKHLLQVMALRLGASHVVVVAPAAAEAARKTFHVPSQRISVIPNAIDSAAVRAPAGFDRSAMRASLGVDPAARVVCAVGRLVPVKGHAVLLEAAATVLRQQPRACFLFVGNGPERESLEARAAALGIASAVRFLGERADVWNVLAASDLFVLASLSEMLPQALLEAMAAGLPVVSTSVGGVPDLVRPTATGWLVPPGDAPALAEALLQALTDPSDMARRAVAGQALVEQQFALSARCERLEALYRSVARRR